MKRKKRIAPKDDAQYYVQTGCDKAGLDVQYISAYKGRGIFSSTSFTRGDFLCEYRGELINQQECLRRQRLYHDHLKIFMFEFKFNGNIWCIDASREDGSYGRLVNDDHINPNAKIKYMMIQGKPHLCLFATRDISPGEEITYNYGDCEWPWRSNTMMGSQTKPDGLRVTENQEVPPVSSVAKILDDTMPLEDSEASTSAFTLKDVEQSLHIKMPLEVPAASTSSSTLKDFEKCKRHRLVFTTVSALDKCVQCVGPVSSLRWMGYKCKVCSGVWHKSCFRRTGSENLEDLCKPQFSDDDVLDNHALTDCNTTDDDQGSSDKEYIPDSDSTDYDSDASIPLITSPSKTGTTETKAVTVNVSNTEDENMVTCAANPCDSTTSAQRTNDQGPIFTSTPVNLSNINYCYICGKAQTKIARHLKTHKMHSEIETIFSLPNKSKERKRLLENLRNRGNFKHNTMVLQSGTGSLKVKRKTKHKTAVGNFIHCMYCKGLYIRKELWRHARRCPEKPKQDDAVDDKLGKRRVLGFAAAVESGAFQKISSGVWKLFISMKDDDVTSVVRSDVCILQFAQSLFNRHGQDQTKYEYMRQKLREVGRLLLCLRQDFSVQSIEDAIKPANFQRVVQSVKKVSGFDEETHSYQTPTLALKLGHSLKKISEIVHCRALMAEDENMAKSTETFKKLYHSKWSEHVSHSALNTLSDAKYNKPLTLPFTEDVQKLHCYLKEQSENYLCTLKEKATTKNYGNLTKVTLAQIIVFNRRRSGEVSKMTLKSFVERDKSQLHKDVAMGLSKVEQKLCEYFTRLEIKGKRGRKVAILLTPKMIDALSLLTSERSQCCVADQNVFLFARPKSMSYYRGQDCLRIYASQCGAKYPEHLRSTQLRKHVATLSQVLNLKNNELDQVADFMGHDIRVHRDFYRLPVPTTQLAKISKLLLSMEKGQLSNVHGKSLDEIEIEGEITVSDLENHVSEDESDGERTAVSALPGCPPCEPKDATGADQDSEDEHIAESSVSLMANKTVSDSKEKDVAEEPNFIRKTKKTWSKVEVTAVMRHFKDHIAKGKLATKNECKQCKEAETPVLEERTVQNIRDFVRNRGIMVKRQSQKQKF